ncbi:hypothetical protein, partial [Massilia sp. BSC265]|uniref:hypothetical protein n=1 Tax=Massilia sp. BSC265 TaxID=1549812 RepID=UPI001E35A666
QFGNDFLGAGDRHTDSLKRGDFCVIRYFKGFTAFQPRDWRSSSARHYEFVNGCCHMATINFFAHIALPIIVKLSFLHATK